MSVARGEPEGPPRRVHLPGGKRGGVLVLPALICAGVVLGLAVTHSGGGRDQRAVYKGVTSKSAAPLTMVDASRDLSPPAVLSPPAAQAVGSRAPVAETSPPPHPSSDAESQDVPAAVVLGEAHQHPAETSGAPEANVRAAALRQIDGSSSSDSLPLLELTLRTDATARNRLLAVNSLRLLGKQADNTERARAALRTAMSDADENVATSARDAYAELTR